jgi:FlgD Ig-like domain
LPRLAVTVPVLALLAATTTAFALTEVLKLERTPIVRPRFNIVFSPGCACPHDVARMSIRLRKPETMDAVIVDSEGDAVRTLLDARRRRTGRLVLKWGGRDDSGAIVPDGTYKVRVSFEGSDRSILVPNPIRVDTKPPTAELVSIEPRAVAPREAIEAVVDSNERARLLLYADGALVARGKLRDEGSIRLAWSGASQLAPGRHVLGVDVQDRAGNTAVVGTAHVQVLAR